MISAVDYIPGWRWVIDLPASYEMCAFKVAHQGFRGCKTDQVFRIELRTRS